MTSLELAAIIVSLAAALGYVNARVFRLPSAIGLMAMAMVGSFTILGLDAAGVVDGAGVEALVTRIDFANVLMHGLLGLLLFAGALHVDLDDLAAHKWSVAALALGGTLLSTALVGAGTFYLMGALGRAVPLGDALIFGALISPTDPIAVLGILKSAKVAPELSIQIAGESLFNDGVGVVLFLVIGAASAGGGVTPGGVATIFLREAIGGAAFGFAIGVVGFQLMRRIDDYSVEVLITLAMVVGGYAAAERLHVSAPIGAVVAGLVVGNHGRRLAMSDVTRQHVDLFWKLIDEILNAVLFLLLGLEATRLTFTRRNVVAALVVVGIVLTARFVSVALPVVALRTRTRFAPHAIKIMTWGGLRGGISVALALSLPVGRSRDTIILFTYVVVACSILGQGLSLGPLLRRLARRA